MPLNPNRSPVFFSAVCAWVALDLVSVWPFAWDGIPRGKNADPRTTLWGATADLCEALRCGEFSFTTLPPHVRENYLRNVRIAVIVLFIGAVVGRILYCFLDLPGLFPREQRSTPESPPPGLPGRRRRPAKDCPRSGRETALRWSGRRRHWWATLIPGE